MNKTKLRFALFVASICLCVSSWAERVAPTFPNFTTLESGKNYYLYNVGTGKFLKRSTVSSSYPGVGAYGAAITITQTSNGSYTMRFADGTTTYYLYADASTTSSRSSLNTTCYFAIKDSLSGYVIQRSANNTNYYVANEYLGYADGASNDRIVPNLTTGNIVWQLMETAEAERYFAKHKLYTALEAMNPYNYNIDQYEAIYANPESTNEELTTAAKALTTALSLTTSFNTPDWTEFPFLIKSGSVNNSGELYTKVPSEGTASITGTVTVDQNSTLVYNTPYSSSNNVSLSVYVDGEIVRTLKNYQLNNNDRCFDKLTPGTHHIEWRWKNTGSSSVTCYLEGIGVRAIPATIEVSLLEPGSLGTEVLYNVDHLKDVRCLKIKGKMNDDDWEKVDMMTNLFSLDLSEADVTLIPESQFNSSLFLHEIILPNALEEIGDNAFRNSYIQTFKFPQTLKRIGEYAFRESNIAGNVIFPKSMELIDDYAFYGCDFIEKAILPDSLESIGDYAFYDCERMTQVTFPKNLKTIGECCFKDCGTLKASPLPEGLVSIGNCAFENASKFNPRLPKTLTTIGESAFMNCAIDSLFIPESLTSWIANSYNKSSNAFSDNKKLVYAEFPTSFYQIPLPFIIAGCENLKTLVFKSPTVVSAPANNDDYKERFLEDVVAENLTIKVPLYLVNSYKLDSYWYNYKIEGFNTADIKDWKISADLVLNARERIEGVPNLTLTTYGSIKVNGENPQNIDNLVTNTNTNNNEGLKFSRILINNDATTIAGKYKHSYYASANKWYFISLPFDFKIDEVTNGAGAKFVIRYYDGAGRASNGAKGNWKNYEATDTVKAGTGFIVQTSANGWLSFYALNNESKQYVVSNKEFVKALDANLSENNSNRGWNLVGNPWQCYFNIHTLNFTAPITVYDVNNKTYAAYSIIDDDYAIRPNEAFFVQCPEGTEFISFPQNGRQLTSVITNQSAARPMYSQASNRQLIDITISADKYTDKTRVVLNETSTLGYETSYDACKFMTMEAGVPQIYTIDNEETEYAINERPLDKGIVKLGVVVSTSGTHRISMPRNEAGSVILIDHKAGVKHDLSKGDYEFTAEAGTYNSRFTLNITSSSETGIKDAEMADGALECDGNNILVNGIKGNVSVYTVDGRKVAETYSNGNVSFNNMPQGIYIVRTVQGTGKVTVK